MLVHNLQILVSSSWANSKNTDDILAIEDVSQSWLDQVYTKHIISMKTVYLTWLQSYWI